MRDEKIYLKGSILQVRNRSGKNIASKYDLALQSAIIANAFTELVHALHQKHGPVVVLVDEYDKAMVDLLADEKRFEENREVIGSLYGAEGVRCLFSVCYADGSKPIRQGECLFGNE